VDGKQILLDRMQALDADLHEARDRLESETIPKSIAARLGKELFDALDDLLSRIAGARQTAQSLPEGDTPEAQSRTKTAWLGFDGLEIDGESLLAEVLALLYGARSRSQTAPHVLLADIADRLMDELSSKLQAVAWKRFTYESEGEAFVGNTQVIRLRFPTKDIWNLPVSVHEFGHFLASQIRVPNQAVYFANVLRTGDDVRKDKDWYYRNEFFADAVAAYAIGPAYGYTCLLVRFNPVRAWSETDFKHPPDGQRAELILQMLERMNAEPDSKGQFEGPMQKLREFWTASLRASGRPVDTPDDQKKAIKSQVDEIYDLILKPQARHLRYNTLPEAIKGQQLLKGNTPNIAKPLALTDLLNAAWRERLRPGVEAADVNQRFLALCAGGR